MRIPRFFVASLLFVGLPAIRAQTSCISCTSSEDAKCASAGYVGPQKDCWGSNACAVSILEDSGHTFRGCSSDRECYDNYEQCETCDGDGCNSVAYPADRRSCVSCVTSTESDCSDLVTEGAEQQFRAACVVHLQEGTCVTLFDHYKPVRRACLGDLAPSLRESCDRGLPDCVQCTVENCNVVTVRPDEQCLQCDSEDRGCTNGQSEASQCAQVSEGMCYSRMLSNNTVQRGCFHELTATEATECSLPDCVVCSGSGCNKATFLARSGSSPLSARLFGYLMAIIFAALIVL